MSMYLMVLLSAPNRILLVFLQLVSAHRAPEHKRRIMQWMKNGIKKRTELAEPGYKGVASLQSCFK